MNIPARKPKIAALILAGGSSKRMGRQNKLRASFHGLSLLSHVVEAAVYAEPEPVIVVTGYDREAIEEDLHNYQVSFTHNPQHKEGMATSLIAGIKSLPSDCDAVVVLLGDMPRISSQLINQLCETFSRCGEDTIVVPEYAGTRGNPVLWPRRYFPEMLKSTGDTGARHLLTEYAFSIEYLGVEDDSVHLDIDTPEELSSWTGS
jgi:molybdenum cofactor cytidylyltransferase